MKTLYATLLACCLLACSPSHAADFTGFQLYNYSTNAAGPFASGATLSAGVTYKVIAQPGSGVAGAQFQLDQGFGSSDTVAPFESTPGQVAPGSHTLTIWPLFKQNKKFYVGNPVGISFFVTPVPTPTPSGTPAVSATPTPTATAPSPTATPTASTTPVVTPTATITPPAPTPTPAPSAPAITKFTLVKNIVDASGTIGITSVDCPDGATYDRSQNLSLVANTSDSVASVQWKQDGVVSVDDDIPFTLAGDSGGDVYMPWTPAVGDHVVTATPFTGLNSGGIAGAMAVVHVHVIDSSPPTPTPTPTPPPPTPTPTPLLVPFAPSLLTATAKSSTSVALTWKDNSIDEDGFLVRRSIDGTTFNDIKSLPANTTAFTDTSAAAGKKYYYRVKAHDATGYSLPSNTASVTTPPLPTPTPSGTPPPPTPTPTPTPVPTPTPTPILKQLNFGWTPPVNLTPVASYRMHWTTTVNKITDSSGGTAYQYMWTDQQDIPKTSTTALINLPDTTQRYFTVRSVGTNSSESVDSNVLGYPSPAP